MQDAVRELVHDGDTVAIEGFTHLINFAAGPRDHPAAAAGPHARPDDARRDLRPDDRRRRRLEADLQLDGQPGGREPPRGPAPDRAGRSRAARDRGVLALRDGLALHGRRRQPAVLPDPQLLRVRHPEGEPEDRADDLAVRGRHRGVRRAGAAARRRDRLRPAGRRRRRHPDLGAARLSEGGRVRGQARDRRRGGGRRGGDDPARPEPNGDPRRDRRRGGRGAVRVPPELRPGLLRPRQPLLPRVGRDREGPRRRWTPGSTSGSTARRTTASTSRSSATRTGTRCGPSRRCRARSTTGGTRERAGRTDSATRRTRS